MKLFLISQNVNRGYDTYNSAVVCAKDEEKARLTHPGDYPKIWDGTARTYDSWVNASDVKVLYIGQAARGIKAGVICSSYNAG